MDETLFATVLRNFQHALLYILPDNKRTNTCSLGPRRHELTLTTKRDSRNFLERLLFEDMYVRHNVTFLLTIIYVHTVQMHFASEFSHYSDDDDMEHKERWYATRANSGHRGVTISAGDDSAGHTTIYFVLHCHFLHFCRAMSCFAFSRPVRSSVIVLSSIFGRLCWNASFCSVRPTTEDVECCCNRCRRRKGSTGDVAWSLKYRTGQCGTGNCRNCSEDAVHVALLA